jgi:multicomponent Na+:H+ antiporter subunit D
MLLAVLSMVVAAFLAVGQGDLKRLMAYSSISQIGYIVLGVGLGTPLGILGGLFHLFNHSVFKSLLFLNSGALEYATGTRDMKKMGGLMAKMPVTGATNLVASMSISGVPPFSGFWSKLIIILALVQAGRGWYAFWAVVASLLTLASYVRAMKHVFFGPLKEASVEAKEVPAVMRLSMMALALICVLGGALLIPAASNIFLHKAQGVLSEGSNYAAFVFEHIK